ncbi:MAG: Macrolide export ATP-binding/permease protein MacB [bacterium]|nr:Macrolide export ATP-binding/permease protein MacB [bacterium]
MKKYQPESWEKIRGQIYEAIREALMTIRGNKMRSFLVILGVMIGVASLMGMVATLSGLEKFIASTISGEGTPYLSLQKADFFAGEGHEEWEKRKNFSVDDASALATLPHVRGVMIVYGRGTVVKYKDRKSQLIQVLGTNQPFLHVQNINVAEGRFFTQFEEEHRRNVVAIGDKAAHSLFPNEDPIGKRIRINGKEYEVVGVFGKRKTIFGGLADNFMTVPYTSFERDFLWWRQGPEFNIIVDRETNVDAARENVRAMMRMRRKVPLSQPDDFALTTAEAQLEFTKKLTDKVALALVVLASIALMVGGIGVMVIMLVSVTERTAEIGIRKAIGATRGQITWQFLIEAATLSGMGGLIGIVVGLAVALIPSVLIGFPYSMPIGWVLVAVLMSLSVGLFFGIFPARKAAKLDPIVALRHE